MKKEKRNFLGSIVSYVLAFVCVTSWVALGVVLALTSANIAIGGNISFTANDVYADVTGTVTGTATTNTLEDIHLTADTTSFTTPSSWSNIAFDFVKGQDIVFTINISNKSTENSIIVAFTDKITATNTTITRKSAGTTVSSLDALVVPKSTTKSVEITLHITNLNKSVSGKFALGLNLTSLPPAKAVDESNYPTLSFTYDNSAKTANISQNSSNKPSGDIVIPSSVLHNGEEYFIAKLEFEAFAGCSALTSIQIPSSVTVIRDSAFEGCSKLTSVTISSGVTSIGGSAFNGCSSLTSITIPESVTSIGGVYTFYGCSKLTSITIPANVGYIGMDAFGNCSSLTSITISSGVTVIGERAFQGCTSLTTISIPASVTSIELAAFGGCSKLTSVTFENTTGWKAGASWETEETTLSSSDLANKTTAATYLTSTYSSLYWTRS